ncbi:MAG: oligosaccharide flippase family protein [Candidatus Krumholzibacteria bacterium]|nr:oligosaccharide flippase family protein [Candidatus Krumholzibacteria bacterium]
MTFARNASITFATRAALVLGGLVTSVIMARMLGPEGRGLFSLAIVASNMVFNATNLGVGAVSGYSLGRKKTPVAELAGNLLSLSVAIGAVALVLSLALSSLLGSRLIPSVPLWAVVVALFAVPFTGLLYNFQMLFRAKDDFRNFNIVEVLQPGSFFVFFVLCAAFVPARLFGASIVAFLASSVIAGLGAVLLMRRCVQFGFRWDPVIVKRTLRFGIQQNAAIFLDLLNYRFDMLLVNYFLDPVAVGFYATSLVIPEKLWNIPNVLSSVLHPRVAHAGDENDANRETAQVSRITVLIIGTACVAILLLGRLLIRLLYQDRFLPAVTPMFIILPGILMINISKVLTSDLIARGFPRANLWAGLVAVASNVACNIVLIPRMGIRGAALASTVSYTLYAVVIVIYFVRVSGARLGSLVVPTAGDARYLVRTVARELSRVFAPKGER